MEYMESLAEWVLTGLMREEQKNPKEISPTYKATWDWDDVDQFKREFKCRGFTTSFEIRRDVRRWIIGEVEDQAIGKFLKQRDTEKSFGEAD